MFALVVDGSIERVGTQPQWLDDSGQLLTDEALEEHGWFAVQPADDVPEGKTVVSTSVELVDGLPKSVHVLADAPPAPIPDRVTSRQFKLQLLASGLIDDVEAWIATQDRAVQIAYATSGTFLRTEPMMEAGFAGLGYTPEQVDAFYLAASEL